MSTSARTRRLQTAPHHRSIAPIALTGTLSLICSVAYSQQALEEVTVTAQRRAQNIQEVPISITAFTAETLREKNLTDINQLSNLTPNVNLDASAPFSGDNSVLSASIRGVGQDDFAFNLDPGVGVYLDGVYLARTIGANQNLLDVERIEILKGPQGTLFGRNTIGGAINIVTHTPGTERRLDVQATGGRFNRRDIGFTLDWPIMGNLLTSLTGVSDVRDGYQRSVPYPEGSPYAEIPFITDAVGAFPKAGYDSSGRNGEHNLQVLRGKVLWDPIDDLRVTFAADWQHQNQSSTAVTTLAVFPDQLFSGIYHFCISNPVSLLNTITVDDPLVAASMPNFPNIGQTGAIFNTTNGLCGPRATGTGFAPGATALGGAGFVGGPAGSLLLSPQPRMFWDFNATNTGNRDTTFSNGVSFAKHDAFGGSLTFDYAFTDKLTLKLISGYRQIQWDIGIDLDGIPEQMQEVTDSQHQRQFSQEIQLQGEAFNDRLNYLVGLYFFQETGYVHDFVPFEGLLYVFDLANDIETDAYAAFFNTDTKLLDRLTLTVGGRYSQDRKLFTGGQADLNGFSYKLAGCNPPESRPDPAPFGPPGGLPNPDGLTCQQLLGFPEADQPLRYFPAAQQKQIFKVFTPRVGLQYQVTDDVMVYASWSKGFKSGGWTTRLSQPILSGTEAEFKPEFNKATEVGVKSELFDNRAIINAALFYSEYDDIQLNVQQGPSPVLQNAGDAIIKGAEFDVQALVGAGFSFNLGAGYIHARYHRINPDTLISIDARLPKTPEYKVTFGPVYEFSLGGDRGRMRVRADYTHTAELFNDAPNTPELRRPSTNALAAAIQYLSPNDKLELTFGGTNLTNDRYLTVGSVNFPAGEIVGSYNRPLEWFLNVRMRLDDAQLGGNSKN